MHMSIVVVIRKAPIDWRLSLFKIQGSLTRLVVTRFAMLCDI